MIRIAIVTLALTMIVGPMIALGLANRPGAPATQDMAPVSQDLALARARAQGLVQLSNVAFQDGVWIIQGATRGGAHLEIDVSSAGDVLNPVK